MLTSSQLMGTRCWKGVRGIWEYLDELQGISYSKVAAVLVRHHHNGPLSVPDDQLGG